MAGSVGKRVLVVEDSPVMRELFRLTFAVHGAVTLDHAEDGMAALVAIRSADAPYDLILLDLNMPVMDGMKLLERLEGEPAAAGTVLAVVTTEASDETEARARALGARYFLRKPVTRRQVDQVIREVFEAG